MTRTVRFTFPLGRVVITANAASQLDSKAIHEALSRHARGDWGDIPAEDVHENNRSLKEGGRLLSAYGNGVQRFWIITEADRSVTTILLPLDY